MSAQPGRHADDERQMKTDPEGWKSDILIFRDPRERAVARADFKQTEYEKKEDVNNKLKLKDHVRYTKRQWKDETRKTRGWDSEEASMDWDERYDPKKVYESEDEEVIEIAQPTICRTVTGRKEKRGRDETKGDAPASRERSRSPPRRTRRSPVPPRGPPSEAPSSAKKAKEVEPIDDDDKDDGKQDAKNTRSRRRTKGKPELPKSADVVEMEGLEVIETTIQQKLKTFNGKTSVDGRLAELISKYKGHPRFPKDAETVAESVATLKEQLVQLKAESEHGTQEGIKPLQGKLDTIVGKLDALETKCSELLSTLEYLNKKEKESERKKYQANYTTTTKLVELLDSKGHPSRYAKALANVLVKGALDAGLKADGVFSRNCIKDPDEFSSGKVQVWTSDQHEYLLTMNAFLQKNATTIEARLSEVDSNLKTYTKWGGCNTDINLTGKVDFAGSEVHEDMWAANAFVTSARKFTCRVGPRKVPMPGMAAFMTPMKSTLTILLFEVKALLKKGIVLHDLLGHLDSPSGETFLSSEHTAIAVLQPKQLLFCLFGWIPQVLYRHTTTTDKKDDWAHLLHVACFSTELAATMTPEIRTAISQPIQDHLEHEAPKHVLFRDSLAKWNAFLTGLDKPTNA